MVKSKVACVAAALAITAGAGVLMPTGAWADMSEDEVAECVTAGECNVDTFTDLLAVFDSTWEATEGEVTINLTDDIEQTTGNEDYLGVNFDWTVNLNLAGHTLVLRNDGARGLQNYGTLVVTGDGTITNTTDDTMNEAYGLIDNYGGTVTIENGTFIDWGQGGGSTLKNRTVSFDDGTTWYYGVLNVNGGTVTGHGTAGGNACIYNDGTLNIADGVELTNYATSETYDGYYGAYALINNTGTMTVGTTVGEISNPVKVTSTRGALGVNSGTVTVNNGEFYSGEYYGAWITNDYEAYPTSVTINYGNFIGEKYGLYASVDDDSQDESNVSIEIANGKFYGNTKAAVVMNDSSSEMDWGIEISGGEYSTLPDESYMADGYTTYAVTDDDYPYMVAAEAAANVDSIYLAEGATYDMTGAANATALAYGVWDATELDGIATLGDDMIMAGVAAGSGEVSFAVTDAYDNELTGAIDVAVYEVTDDFDDDAEEIIETIVNGGEADNFTYAEGVTSDDVKVAAVSGAFTTALVSDDVDEDDIDDAEKAAIAAEVEESLADGATIAGYYDINVELLAVYGDDTVLLGYITKLSSPTTVTVALPDDLAAVADGYTRTYYMVRYHNGTTTVIEVTDNGDGTISFDTDSFSTYALVYVDTLDTTTPETGTVTRESGSVMVASIFTAAVVGILVSIVSLAYLIRRQKR